MGPDVNARQELTAKPVLICLLSFLLTTYLTLNPRLFHLRLWLVPIALGSVWSLCTKFAISDPSFTAVNFGTCSVGFCAAIKLLELATLDTPPKYDGQTVCEKQSILCWDCAVNTVSYLFDFRCRHWNKDSTRHTPEDARRDGSHAEFYIDTLMLALKHGLYIDALLPFITNINQSGSSQGGTIFRDTFALTSNHTIQLPHPLLGALPLTIAVGLLVQNGLEFENYVVTLLAVPLMWLPPSISPYSRPASSLKYECPPLFDHPYRANSLGEFWSKRWQSMPRRMFLVGGARPGRIAGGFLGSLAGKTVGLFSSSKTGHNEWSNRARSLGSRVGFVMGAFLVSGLMHDFGMWGMGQGVDFQRVTGYFLIQGVGVILESLLGLDQTARRKSVVNSPTADKNSRTVHKSKSSMPYRLLMKLWVFGWVVVPATMMMEAWLQRGFDLITLVPYAYSPSRTLLNFWNGFAFGK
ncbi:hypothetical protein FRC09_007182 [Ceratobasidium sp. 395]|nr:hypothetical protein FRC09_007182 [Ceratobasidium sp. 395]